MGPFRRFLRAQGILKSIKCTKGFVPMPSQICSFSSNSSVAAVKPRAVSVGCLRRYILVTLCEGSDRSSLSAEEITDRLRKTFVCRSVVVSSENHAFGGKRYHVGVWNETASKYTVNSRIRKLFPEFEGDQCNVSSFKAWNTVCSFLLNLGKTPTVWGEDPLEAVKERARASSRTSRDPDCDPDLAKVLRSKNRASSSKSRDPDLAKALRSKNSWEEVLGDDDLVSKCLTSYSAVRSTFEDLRSLEEKFGRLASHGDERGGKAYTKAGLIEQSAGTVLMHPLETHTKTQEVVIALGSNVGDRVTNFDKALQLMKTAGINVVTHASLYESAPAYVTNQPKFLNSAVKANTKLDPHELLKVLKEIEGGLGRLAGGLRYGPRPLDLDILFYGQHTVSSDSLTIPHPRIWERPFVLAPLMDLYNTKLAHDGQVWSARFEKARHAWELMGGDAQLGEEGLKRVMPLGKKLWDWSDRTRVMGILNVTPDSFSDGGRFLSVSNAAAQAQAMAAAGVDLIDVGAQSTRPHATRLTSDEELERLLPVVQAIAELPEAESFHISVDTFDAKVAREAVNIGAHMVNDVSGGCLDPDMYSTIAELGVPYALMHMRGDPTTMQNENNTSYSNVCEEVAGELCSRIEHAESMGVPAWRIITDPGLGFSKTFQQNLHLMGNLSLVRTGLATWSMAAFQAPMLVGPSRKSFLGKICGHEKPEDRDAATIGAVVSCIVGGADVVRVHNVKASSDATRVADAIFRPTGSHKRMFWKKEICTLKEQSIVV